MKTYKESEDRKVKFYEKTHKYKLGKTTLTSGTTFLKDFFPEFNAKEIARKLAKFPKNKALKHGVKYFLKQWKDDAQHGTDTHYLMECYFKELQKQGSLPESGEELEQRTWNKFQHSSKWLDSYLERVAYLYGKSEYIIYNEDLGIAGQIDLLVKRVDENDNEVFDLIDYKTNKAISDKNYDGTMCNKPIECLEASTLMKYCLQLSLYAYMLERRGNKIGDLILVHITENGVKEINVGYLKKEIETMVGYKK